MTNEELDEVCRRLNDTATLAAIQSLRLKYEQLGSGYDSLRAENERLARDTRRYQWLRRRDADLLFMFDLSAKGKPLGILSEGLLDAAIDAAMSKQEKMDDKASGE